MIFLVGVALTMNTGCCLATKAFHTRRSVDGHRIAFSTYQTVTHHMTDVP